MTTPGAAAEPARPHRRRAVGFALAMLGCLVAPRAEAIESVVVLKSDSLAVYDAPIAAFEEAIGRPVTVLDIEGQRAVAKDMVTRLRFDPPPLVFALGAKAAWMVHEQMPHVPLVYGMIRDPERYGLEGRSVTGVGYEIPYDTLMGQVQLFLPHVRKIGVILTNQNPAVQELRTAARNAELEIDVSSVHDHRDVRGACTRISKRVDALLVIHDPEVLTPENFRFIREQAGRAGIPIIATSEALARSGALLAVVPDYSLTGSQAAQLGRRILEGDSPAELPRLQPEGARVLINRAVLESLDLEIDPMLLDFTDEVIEEGIGR
jgi:putative ABC transport system substrate-binding protein